MCIYIYTYILYIYIYIYIERERYRYNASLARSRPVGAALRLPGGARGGPEHYSRDPDIIINK